MGIMGKDRMMGLFGDDATTEMVQQMATSNGVHPGDIDLESALASVSDTTAVAAGEPSGMEVVKQTLGKINLPQVALAFLFFFIFGYLLYASLFAAIGSSVENEGDSTQLQLPVTIPLLLGFFVALYAFKAPDSQLVFWFSMIPFTSPIVMLARLPFGVATWELILSIVLLILTFIGCAWASAKIYKVGILMYGKKSTFKDLWKWLKQK
jgi:ABC-2 type transport system permease protein